MRECAFAGIGEAPVLRVEGSAHLASTISLAGDAMMGERVGVWPACIVAPQPQAQRAGLATSGPCSSPCHPRTHNTRLLCL